MLVVPGVTGSSDDPYIVDLCGAAQMDGFSPIVINCLATKDDDIDHRVLDFSDSAILRATIDMIHKKMGDDCEIYAVGFSLGANHLLRYLGDHHHDTGIKAAISISNPFDVLSTSVKIRNKFFGLYDRSLKHMLAKPFIENKFKHQLEEETMEKIKKAKDLIHFDRMVRAKILGYNSVHMLYRNVSCDRFVGSINVPFLVLHANDDPISMTKHLPVTDLVRNPNCLLIQTDVGGHCDFFMRAPGKKLDYQRFYPDIVLKYFEEVERFNDANKLL